jgi:hypothetical protein
MRSSVLECDLPANPQLVLLSATTFQQVTSFTFKSGGMLLSDSQNCSALNSFCNHQFPSNIQPTKCPDEQNQMHNSFK